MPNTTAPSSGNASRLSGKTKAALNSISTSKDTPKSENSVYSDFDPNKTLSKMMVGSFPWTQTGVMSVVGMYALVGNLTIEHLEKFSLDVRIELMDSMNKMGVKLHKRGVRLAEHDLNAARVAQIFPGAMFYALKQFNELTYFVERELSPEVIARVPKPLRFLEVGCLACVTSVEEEKAKIIEIARLVNNDFTKNFTRVTNLTFRDNFEEVLRSQLAPSAEMTKMTKFMLGDAKDLSAELAKFK